MLLRENRAAGGDAADDWQLEQAPEPVRLACIAHADAARGSRGNLDRALFLEGAQMLLGGVDRAKAHPRRDLGARRRIARYLGQLAHQAQDLALSSRQFFHTGPPYTGSISSMSRPIKSARSSRRLRWRGRSPPCRPDGCA